MVLCRKEKENKKINTNLILRLFNFPFVCFCLQLTGAADGFDMCGLQWLVEDHNTAQLALQ